MLGSGWTKYDKLAFYDGIDVTSAVQAGQNAVGIALGQGTLNGLHTRATAENRGAWDGILRTRALLQVTYADGTTQSVPTSTGWTAAQDQPGPIRSPPARYSRRWRATTPGASSRAGTLLRSTTAAGRRPWPSATAARACRPALSCLPARGARSAWTALPRPATGVFVYNVGQNIAGNARITLDVPAGTAVRIRYAESLSNGRAAVIGDRPQDDTFISKGSGPAIWTASFTYKGFQYVEVSGVPGSAPAPRVTALRIHNDVRSVGTFDSSNDVLNFVHKAGRETILNNFVLAAPTDGSYLEKLPWLGDGAVMAEAGMRNFDAKNLYIKWYNDLADSQRSNRDMPAWAPVPDEWSPTHVQRRLGQRLHRSGDPARAGSRRRGRPSPPVTAQLKAYAELMSCKPPTPVKCGATGCAPTETACATPQPTRRLVGARLRHPHPRPVRRHRPAARPCRATPRRSPAAPPSARTTFNNDYFRSGTYRTASGARFLQTNNVLPVAFGITPAANRQAVVNAVAADVAARGNHLGTGVLGHQVAVPGAHPVRTRSRPPTWRPRNRTAPGYGAWLAAGATTLWEEWTTTRSKGHPFLGTAEDWMLADVAGLARNRKQLHQGCREAAPSGGTPTGLYLAADQRRHRLIQLDSSTTANSRSPSRCRSTGRARSTCPSRAASG